MNRQRISIFLGIFLVILCIAVFSSIFSRKPAAVVHNFEECVESGKPVMESYPRQCRSDDGRIFVEDIGNMLEKEDLIVLESPRPGDTISSPLLLKGKARGNWFFEASFPVILLDDKNTEIAAGIAQAQGEWMTTEFVPFSATLTFVSKPAGKGTLKGKLILKKDNPSGDPMRDDALVVPVSF